MEATSYAGIDYGRGLSNIDHETGIRYGIIPEHYITQTWADSSEPDYGDPHCPKCGGDAKEINNEDIDEWEHAKYESEDYLCEDCKYVFGSESAFPEEVSGWYVDEGENGIKAFSDDNGDIWIVKSPFYSYAQFCSPCAPGAVHLGNPLKEKLWNENNKGFCMPHDWFESIETDRWIDCKYCNGTGLRGKLDILGYDEERFIKNGGSVFDDKRVKCWACSNNEQYGQIGKVKEMIRKAPYRVLRVSNNAEVLPKVEE